MSGQIELGDEVEDVVTGFRGITTCKTDYLNGCAKFGVQPKQGKDGKMPETWHIDEPQLKVVKKSSVKPGITIPPATPKNPNPQPVRTGGPSIRGSSLNQR
jgi:hypothetical protein